MSRPDDLMYSATHEWVRLASSTGGDASAGDVVTVGITDYAVEQLSDLAFVDLPEPGTEVEKGARFGEIESTKTVSDLIAPVSGEITAVNGEIVDNLQLLSDSPFEAGWLIKIRLVQPAELKSLLTASDYAAHLETEDH